MSAAEGHIPTPWLGYQGFEACIIVNNVAATCFGADYCEAENEGSAWIASEANKAFVIDYRKTVESSHDYCVSLFLDGKKIKRGVAIRNSVNNLKSGRISRIPVSAKVTRRFKFNYAALTDDDTYLDNPSSTGIGEIKVVLQVVKVTAETEPQEANYAESLGAAKIHEKLNKGLVHQIGYGSKKRPSEVPRKRFRFQPIGKSVTLLFKYRSLDWLQARGIAPHPGTPPIEEEPGTEASSHQSPEVQAPTTEKKERCDMLPGVKREDTANDESEEEDTDQIVIKSLRTLLFELENAANKKRARKEARSQTSTKAKTEGTDSHLEVTVARETADPKARQENPVRPKKKVKTNPAEAIDLTWL